MSKESNRVKIQKKGRSLRRATPNDIVVSKSIDFFQQTEEELIRTNAAFAEGYAAGFNGDLYKNPYQSLSLFIPALLPLFSWRRGYTEGRHEANQKMLEMD